MTLLKVIIIGSSFFFFFIHLVISKNNEYFFSEILGQGNNFIFPFGIETQHQFRISTNIILCNYCLNPKSCEILPYFNKKTTSFHPMTFANKSTIFVLQDEHESIASFTSIAADILRGGTSKLKNTERIRISQSKCYFSKFSVLKTCLYNISELLNPKR